jgi:hypothetical protein
MRMHIFFGSVMSKNSTTRTINKVSMVDALGAVRLKCNDIRLAIRARRKELRDKGK